MHWNNQWIKNTLKLDNKWNKNEKRTNICMRRGTTQQLTKRPILICIDIHHVHGLFTWIQYRKWKKATTTKKTRIISIVLLAKNVFIEYNYFWWEIGKKDTFNEIVMKQYKVQRRKTSNA